MYVKALQESSSRGQLDIERFYVWVGGIGIIQLGALKCAISDGFSIAAITETFKGINNINNVCSEIASGADVRSLNAQYNAAIIPRERITPSVFSHTTSAKQHMPMITSAQ